MKTVLKSEQKQITRLFSHLDFDGDKFNHQPGSVLGSTALIAGTTVGAGILALPAVTLPSGVLPSTTLLIAVWLYTLFSGLLIAEVTLNVMRLEGIPNLGFLAIVEKTLGKVGARVAGTTYLFMHYALLVAYISKGGDILASALTKIARLEHLLPNWVGTTTFTLLFGSILYLGKERFIQKLNNAFVAIVIISFVCLLWLGAGQVKSTQFLFQNWHTLGSAISVMCVALFYHNIVPVVVTQLEGDIPKIRQSIIIGSAIPLMMFLAWNAVILGSINPDILQNNADNSSVFDPLQILRTGNAGELIGLLITVFSEFAIITSFIGFVYGLIDFFQDISRIRKTELSRLPLYSIVLFPPMSLGTVNPTIFFAALDYTGIFSISVLGGIIPAIMSWQQREQHKLANGIYQSLIPGGKITLTVMIAIALALIIKQILSI
ncbi:tyrosine transporter [Anabaena cylindrica FACHB-243]|uniref:amino acid permease n=1 Tax=Anabaena TaxID=1163 RepID=UPI000B6095FD|nr:MULTISPECIES: aromatic amino acid transport family protein [Anabaena]BAY05654.1 aromatic amino acid permease [Anabaena cylindrica PCC 7122]MBD2421037.1 tyrosine transporter [Anabaena cylindrica FACHB-243]MBY5280741.1 tyrosine transporter [Anabaena sp. CCAP 1446/1C]MBY5306392.1 tyrosine transporter [Anabaena sp. CCAP 1446/1C]MCM2405789.1 tyrosine transporter [Anabaena sp. CCAP 1446/1C]